MNDEADLHALEKKLFRSYWEDGLIDLFVGVALVLIGVTWYADLVALSPLIPIVLLPFWLLAKNRITAPRMGYVEFSESRTLQLHQILRILALFGLGMLVIFTTAYVFLRPAEGGADSWLGVMVPALPGMLLALILVAGGLAIGQRRCVIYAFVVLGVSALSPALPLEPHWQFLVGGGVTALGGLLLLTRFMTTYPVFDVPT